MTKITMLGTGMGTVFDLYNTCFVMQNNDKYLLVDTGGSIQIIKNLKKCGIELNQIHDVFISHCHTDHILGLFWLLKKISILIIKGEYKDDFNVYCNDEVATSINSILPHIYPAKLTKAIKEKLKIHILNDHDTVEIVNIKMTFFDTFAKGNKLYGFETIINGKKLVFLGDEPINKKLINKVKDADYVMHEAFCLDSDANIFHPYELNHSTVKSVCCNLHELNIKNLILYHTEESHGKERKKLYTEEGKKYFKGNVIVPDDLETIELL